MLACICKRDMPSYIIKMLTFLMQTYGLLFMSEKMWIGGLFSLCKGSQKIVASNICDIKYNLCACLCSYEVQ